jgi:antirestriction protein ArdC
LVDWLVETKRRKSMSEKMTATQARTFERGISEAHYAILTMTAESKRCNCEPYVDWYTYRRWQAQGMQVQKGEKGTKLTTYIPVFKKDENGEKKQSGTRPKGYSVFCRCQVKPK